MDPSLLQATGYRPGKATVAHLNGYRLCIGNRATLLPDPEGCAYGTVMQLTADELVWLYSGDGVQDYGPGEEQVVLRAGQKLAVVPYLLPAHKLAGTNSDYAVELAKVAQKMGLPDAYVQQIRSWVDEAAP